MVRQGSRRAPRLAVASSFVTIGIALMALPALADPGNGNAYGHDRGTGEVTTTTAAPVPATSAPGASASSAGASGTPPGNNGTVKVHALDTSAEDPRTVPHPGCPFGIVGFGFDPGQLLAADVAGHGGPKAGAGTYSSGQLAAGSDGSFVLGPLALASGTYKLTLTTGMGAAKHKVFHLECSPDDGTGSTVTELPDVDETGGPTTLPVAEVAGRSVTADPADTPIGRARARTVAHRGRMPFTGVELTLLVIGLVALLGGALMLMSGRRDRGSRLPPLDV